MRMGFYITDDEDYYDKLLIRIFGFTLLGIAGGGAYGMWNLTILGVWVEFDERR